MHEESKTCPSDSKQSASMGIAENSKPFRKVDDNQAKQDARNEGHTEFIFTVAVKPKECSMSTKNDDAQLSERSRTLDVQVSYLYEKQKE